MGNIEKQELHDIFIGISNNDDMCFNKLYEKYSKLIYSIAFSILKNKEDAEDVMQKVFVKICNIDKDKLPKKCEATWLYSITKNETLNFLKSKKIEYNLDDLYNVTNENKELNELIDKEDYNRIIEKLTLQEQEIISLKILSNLSFKQISLILNIPIGTVKWKYYKSIHSLKLLLGNLGMFIITFIIGVKTLLSTRKKENKHVEELEENDIIKNTTADEEQKVHVAGSNREEANSKLDEENGIQEDETQQIVIQEQSNINSYYTIGILGVSVIFLIVTLYFLIISMNHQLKKKKKLSK